MESIERVRETLNFSEPDRVPFDLCGTTVTGIADRAFLTAMKQREIYFDRAKELDPVQQVVTPPEELLKFLEVDTRRVAAPRIFDFESKLKRTGSVMEVFDQWSCTWRMDKESDLFFSQTSYPIKGASTISEGLESYGLPEPIDFEEEMIANFNRQTRDLGSAAWIADRDCAGLTEMAFRIRGYENFFMDMALDKDGALSLIDALVDHKIAYWEILADYILEHGLEDRVLVASECDDLGTQESLLFSPEMIRGMLIPRFKKLFSFIKGKLPNVKIFFHCDGAIRSIIPDLIEAGMDILNPIQVSAKGMDPKKLKKDFGKDLVLWGGGIDTQKVLPRLKPEQVKDEVKRMLDILAPGGGYVFATIHNIQADVPPENFWAMWETLREYGTY